MRISLLLQREPFADILEHTLSEFLRERFGNTFTVKWLDTIPSDTIGSEEQLWYCNAFLNAIFVPQADGQVFRPVIREFSRSTVWWRRPFQKVYVTLAANRFFNRFAAHAGVSISPPLEGAKHYLILGGNHHIRLLDWSTNIVYVIAKAGFERDLLIHDVHVRSDHPYLPTPRILDTSDSKSWYSEELIVGTPLNRLSSATEQQHILMALLPTLFQLYEKTVQWRDIDEYTQRLTEDTTLLIQQNSLLSQDNRNTLLLAIEKLIQIIESGCQIETKTIAVSQTHGDFQPANILVNGTDVWLIDWEYTRKRQIAYDGLVFALNSRFPQGLAGRVLHAINHSFPDIERIFVDWPHVNLQDRAHRLQTIALFLLEELALKVWENSNPLFTRIEQGFFVFLKEMQHILHELHETL